MLKCSRQVISLFEKVSICCKLNLDAGNFGKRESLETTIRHLWRNVYLGNDGKSLLGAKSFGRKTFCRKTVGSIDRTDPLNILTSNFEGGAAEFRGKACASQTSRPEFESQHSVKFMLNGFSSKVWGEK